MSKQRRFAWLILILLAASFLRLHKLPQVPPGMTHDEADHGLDAWRVVQGDHPLYFSVGYGREPLFDYSTAVLMTFLGPTYLAGRLTAVFYSLLLIAGNYAWIRRAFGQRYALLAAAGLAVSFWPVMTARQALRSITMPALFVLATYFFWTSVEAQEEHSKPGAAPATAHHRRKLYLLVAGILLGLTFYTYIPARVLWLIFPALLLYRVWLRRPAPWRDLALMLLLAGFVALPLFLYLYRNPQAEVRIDQLLDPLRLAWQGNFGLLLVNVKAALRIFSFRGDSQWRYNLAGRPLLGPVMSLLFYLGLGFALLRSASSFLRRDASNCPRAPALFFVLLWLLLGFAPALITGPDLSTTQTIAMQPILYLFPAITLVTIANWKRAKRARWVLPLAAVLLFTALFANTLNTYFYDWAKRPEVATQYEAELVEIVRYLNVHGQGTVAISTDAPNRFHDPATAALYLTNDAVSLRWFDGRHSLLLPQATESTLLFSTTATLHRALNAYLQRLPLTPISTGLGVNGYKLSADPSTLEPLYPQFIPKTDKLSTELSTVASFSNVVRFLGYELETTVFSPGATIHLATLWQVEKPVEETLVLFTHVLNAEGRPVAQVDRLDVPSYFWQANDAFIQLHEVTLPEDLPPGKYDLTIGIYREADWQQRLPVLIEGDVVDDVLRLPPITVTP